MAKKEASPHITPTTERQSKLTRSSNYRQSCTAWYSPGHTPAFQYLWQAHHVVCEHAVGGREIQDSHADYVERCLWVTPWDLNNSDNLVGLPQNKQYRASNGKVPINMPSHQVDHNTKDGYTDECKEWLEDNLWDTLTAAEKPHEAEAEDVSATFETGTTIFKGRLVARGSRETGTANAWDNRFDPAWEDTWYHPFSMAADPNPRSPGKSLTDLTYIFKKLKPK